MLARINVALFALAAFLVGAACNARPEVPVGTSVESPANAATHARGYTLGGDNTTGGLWVQRDSDPRTPFAAVYSEAIGGPVSVIGLSRDQKGHGHDFAIVASRTECYFQIRDAAGKYHFVPVEALVKLEEKK